MYNYIKKFNLLLFIFLVAILLVLGFNIKYTSEIIVFHGFANNKELIVNLENPALVKEIHVKPGQRVSKGEVLIEVSRSIIALNQSDINHDISNLQSQYHIWQSGLKNSLRTIEAQKHERKNELQSAIQQLESEMQINASLIKEIESIDQITDDDGNNPSYIQLTGLKSELDLSMMTFNSEIRKIQNELSNPSNPLKIQVEKLSNNLEFVNEAEENLHITAPNHGIVGSILCKVGENIPAFTPYLTVYEEAPNHVKGYVLENLIVNVRTCDTLTVQSVSHTNVSIEGVVIGMGSRIVEIPARLSKNPNYASFGREIEIRIPSLNPFLQNEKVILKKSMDKKLVRDNTTVTSEN